MARHTCVTCKNNILITLLMLKGLTLIALSVMGSKCLVNCANYR